MFMIRWEVQPAADMIDEMVLGMPIPEIGCHKLTICLVFQVNVATNTE